MWFYKRKGFTLLELMIVVIIIGILASLALPRFIKARMTAKSAEALVNLGMVRSSEWRYYLVYDTFTNNLNNLDVDNPNNVPNVMFDYDITSATASGVDIRARYDPTGSAPSAVDYITMDEDGNIAKFGVF